MATVFSHNPIQGDTWDMQGALLYFGTAEGGSPSSSANTAAMPTSYSASNSNDFLPIVAIGVRLTLQRGITKRYPINVRRVIYMVGHPDGQMQISCLFGPNQSMSAFLKKFNAVGTNEVNPTAANGTCIFIKPFGQMFSNSNTTGQAQTTQTLGLGTWVVTDPVIAGMGLTISESGSQQIPASADVTFTFTGLDIIDDGNSGDDDDDGDADIVGTGSDARALANLS